MADLRIPDFSDVPAVFAAGPGGMARLVGEFEWSKTPLGPMPLWPIELKTAVSLMLESRFPAAIVWGPGLTTIYNDAFRPILGDKPEALGRPFSEVWAEAWDQIGPILENAFHGEATYIEDFPLEIDRSGRLEQAWFTFCYSPLRLADGTVAGMFDTVVETTKTVRARQELEILNHELRHRLKNTLATVQSLAWQTLPHDAKSAPTHALIDRIAALGAAHDVLFRHGWAGANVREVAVTTLYPLAPKERTQLSGPETPINAQAAVALALILHELATNALKHGSLSTAGGSVSLTWRVENGVLVLLWREIGGPRVAPPDRVGFGSRLIARGLGPHGRVSTRFLPAGLEAELTAPLSDLMSPDDIEATPKAGPARPRRS